MATTLTTLRDDLQRALQEVPTLDRRINRARADLANARMGAGSDLERTEREVAALDTLRGIEGEVLDQLVQASVLASEHRRTAGDLATDLTPGELATMASLRAVHGTGSRPEVIERELRTASLTENRPTLAFWRGEALALPAADLDRPESDADRSARRRLPLLIREADAALRNMSGDAVTGLADELEAAAGTLQRRIDQARQHRGEGGFRPTSNRLLVPVEGAPIYSLDGYEIVGYHGHGAIAS